jgi:hypothetical protein
LRAACTSGFAGSFLASGLGGLGSSGFFSGSGLGSGFFSYTFGGGGFGFFLDHQLGQARRHRLRFIAIGRRYFYKYDQGG